MYFFEGFLSLLFWFASVDKSTVTTLFIEINLASSLGDSSLIIPFDLLGEFIDLSIDFSEFLRIFEDSFRFFFKMLMVYSFKLI